MFQVKGTEAVQREGLHAAGGAAVSYLSHSFLRSSGKRFSWMLLMDARAVRSGCWYMRRTQPLGGHCVQAGACLLFPLALRT